MRLVFRLLVALTVWAAAAGQAALSSPATTTGPPGSPPTDTGQPPAPDAGQAPAKETQPDKKPDAEPAAGAESAPASGTADKAEPPFSLDRIKEGLARPPQTLHRAVEKLDREPDFRVEIQEWQRFEELIDRLKIEASAPAPAGGLYAYEQQQRLFRPTDRPLMQPYAAFSPRELTIVALENIIGQYLARKVIGALGSDQRAAAERAAREEMLAAVAAYCAVQPARGAGIEICTLGP
jgi:hypothetical protein